MYKKRYLRWFARKRVKSHSNTLFNHKLKNCKNRLSWAMQSSRWLLYIADTFLPDWFFFCQIHKNQSILPKPMWMGQTILQHFDASKQHIFYAHVPSAPPVAVTTCIVISTSPYNMIDDYQLNLITQQNRNTAIIKYLPWTNKETYRLWNLIPFQNIKNHLVIHEGCQDIELIY